MTDDERKYLFEELCGEAGWAVHYWRLDQRLFGDRQHVDVMRKTAPIFFGLHQRLLIDGMLLSIQTLLDPAISSRGDKSATLEMLLHGLPRGANATTRSLRKRLARMRKECEEIKDWRNREGAHLDLQTVLIQAPEPKVRLRVVAQVTKDIIEFLKDFAAEFYPDVTHIVEEPELDGDTLMFLLEQGQARHTS